MSKSDTEKILDAAAELLSQSGSVGRENWTRSLAFFSTSGGDIFTFTADADYRVRGLWCSANGAFALTNFNTTFAGLISGNSRFLPGVYAIISGIYADQARGLNAKLAQGSTLFIITAAGATMWGTIVLEFEQHRITLPG